MNTFVSILGRRGAFAAAVACMTVAAVPMVAQAQSISGTISFTGGATLDNPIGPASTQYTGFFGTGTGDLPVVLGGSQTGTFASVPAMTPVTFYPFLFVPSITSPELLWSFSSGGDIYSFTATSGGVVNNTGYLNLQGNGIISITGFTSTAATWSYTDTGSGTSVSLGASITATPEPSTISLVAVLGGFGCLVRIAVRRKTSRQGGLC